MIHDEWKGGARFLGPQSPPAVQQGRTQRESRSSGGIYGERQEPDAFEVVSGVVGFALFIAFLALVATSPWWGPKVFG